MYNISSSSSLLVFLNVTKSPQNDSNHTSQKPSTVERKPSADLSYRPYTSGRMQRASNELEFGFLSLCNAENEHIENHTNSGFREKRG